MLGSMRAMLMMCLMVICLLHDEIIDPFRLFFVPDCISSVPVTVLIT